MAIYLTLINNLLKIKLKIVLKMLRLSILKLLNE